MGDGLDMEITEFKQRISVSRMEPSMREACLAVTDILVDLRPGDGKHLGFSFFYERLKQKDHQEKLLSALSILCTREGAILKMQGYLDDDIEGQLHLSDEDFSELSKTGQLAHPHSGEPVTNALNKVRIFYSLREHS